MIYYASKTHDSLNARDFNVERITPYVCLNPYYPVTINEPDTKYMIDSGAFQDVRAESRLTFEGALERQLAFEGKVGVRQEQLVSYDRLVDEQMRNGAQIKERVSLQTGREYVDETVGAQEYLVSQRDRLEGRKLILSCQGQDQSQYLDCLERVLDISGGGDNGDIIGLGGFCILSKSKKYEEEFYKVIQEGFPMMRDRGIKRVHIFGMSVFRVLVQTDIFARMNGLECSYDTSSAEVNQVFGRGFNPVDGQLQQVFSKIQKGNGYYAADLAKVNIATINRLWEGLAMMPLPDSGFVPGMEDTVQTEEQVHMIPDCSLDKWM